MAPLALALALAAPPELHEWSITDTALQATFVLITATDWAQTRSSLNDDYYETNPLLGKYPSKTKVDLYMGGAILAHTAIAYALPKPWRTLWQVAWISIEGAAVYGNHQIGVRIHW